MFGFFFLAKNEKRVQCGQSDDNKLCEFQNRYSFVCLDSRSYRHSFLYVKNVYYRKSSFCLFFLFFHSDDKALKHPTEPK